MNSICKSDWFEPVPNTWSVQRMKNIMTPKEGRSSDGNEELLSVTIQNGVVKRSQYLDDDDGGSRADSLVGYKIVHRDDLVNNIMKMSFRCLGVSPHDGIVSPAYSVFEINREKVDPNYLNYQLRIDRYVYEYRKLSKGIQESRMRLYDDYFLSMKVIVPSIEEQKLISSYLDKKTNQIDSLVEKFQKKIQLLKKQRTSLINHYVTKGLDPNVEMKDSGVEWIGEIPKHWEVTRLKFCSTIVNGFAFKSDDFELDNEIPIIRIGDVKTPFDLNNCVKVTKEIYEKNKDFQVLRGDILVGMTGGTIGKSALYDLEEVALLNQRVCIFRSLVNSDQNFLSIYMNSKLFKEQITLNSDGGGQPNIGREELMNFDIFLPPLEEQIKIFAHLSSRTQKYQSLIDREHSRISILLEYRQSLISSVVTGKVRVTEDMI